MGMNIRVGRRSIAMVSALAVALGPSVSCRGAGDFEVYASEYSDVYVQEATREVDVLFIIDSSGSMQGEQSKLSTNFQAFIEAFIEGEVNYHIGVITTDVADASEAGRIRGLPLEPGETPPPSGIIPPTIITPDTVNAAAVFEELVTVGTFGSGLEMGLEAARLALSDPLLTGHNAPFFRQEAALAIVAVSDEDDLSPFPVDDYLNFFAILQGGNVYRSDTRMTISAVVGELPGGCTAIEGEDISVAGPGFRYVDAANRSGGTFASICAEDYAPVVEGLGLDISGLATVFPVSYCAKAETLEVFVGESLKVQGEDYTYDPAERAIRFDTDSVPPSQSTVTINYEFYPENRFVCPDA